MKKCVCVVICVLVLVFFVQAKHHSEHKISFSPSGESSIQVEGFESKIFVKGELSYSNDTGLFYSGEMKFTVDESGWFPFIKALIQMLRIKGELITTSPVTIKTKQNIPIKLAQEIFKPEKEDEYFVYSLPAELVLKEKLYFDVKQETEIKIYEIKFDYCEDVKFDFSIDAEFKGHRILEFEMPEIDYTGKNKFIMMRVYFDEDKNVSKVNVIESTFTEEEEAALVESIKGAKVINKEEIGKKILWSYEFVRGKKKTSPHEIKTGEKKEGPVLEGLNLGSMKTKELVYLLIDDPKDVKNNNVVVNELVKRGKSTIKCLIKATNDKKFQGRGYSAWALAKVIKENGDIKKSKGTRQLCELLKDEDQYVRKLSSSGLEQVNDEKTIKTLIDNFDPNLTNYKITLEALTGEVFHSKEDAQKWWEKNKHKYSKQL